MEYRLRDIKVEDATEKDREMPFSEAVDPSGFLLLSETDVNTNTSFIAVAIQLLTTFGALPRMIAEYGGYMPKLGISDNETKRSLGIF